MLCPRCGAKHGIRDGDGEPSCTICGWVDYLGPPKPSPIHSILTGPHGYLVPYRGTTESLGAVQVKVVFRRTRTYPTPICPYDGERMVSVGFTRRKRQGLRRHSQFRCLGNRHLIALERDLHNEATGWR